MLEHYNVWKPESFQSNYAAEKQGEWRSDQAPLYDQFLIDANCTPEFDCRKDAFD
jgi:hypothetical protein